MVRRSAATESDIRYRIPRVEISETADSVMLRAEMPGVDKESLDIQIDNGELTIKGKRKPVDSGLTLIHAESDPADYLRAFTLGDQVDTSKVEAQLSQGILTLTLHKKEEVLPRKITVRAE